jgi:IS30 family transposase
MQIQPNERDKIALWLGIKLSVREISRRLGRDPSVISREIERNSFGDFYIAIHAQHRADSRSFQVKQMCWWEDQALYSYVVDRLKDGWIPEQIDGRIKLKNGHQVVSYESIYRFIYDPINKDKKL